MFEFGSNNSDSTLFISREGKSFDFKGEKKVFLGYQSAESSHDGVWARWEYENGILHFDNDQFGIYPIYYYIDKETFIISSSLVNIIKLANPGKIDCDALSVFLRTGFFVGNDTPFLNIKVPPPGCRLTWDNGSLDITSPKITCQVCNLDRSDAIKKYGSIFQENMEKCSFSQGFKVGLPLSGGRDSRHILFALLKNGMKPDKCITMKHFPPKSNEDCDVARNLTNELNLDHVVINPSNNNFKVEIEKNYITNFCANQHAWLLPLSDYFFNSNFDIIYDGIAGDVLSTTVFSSKEKVKLYNELRFAELAELILGSEGFLPSILSKKLYESLNRSIAIERIVKELKVYAETPNPVSQFYFWNKTRRQTSLASWGILNRSVHVVAPFLDGDTFSFLSSIPSEYIFEGECFHTEAISNYYPEYANLPFEKSSGSFRKSTYSEILKFSISMSRYILKNKNEKSSVNVDFVIKRLIKGLIDKEYGTRLPTIMNVPIYLKQLDGFTGNIIDLL